MILNSYSTQHATKSEYTCDNIIGIYEYRYVLENYKDHVANTVPKIGY
jgi:hypothetical protein